MRAKTKQWLAGVFAAVTLAACSVVRVLPAPLNPFPQTKPLVIVVCGWRETPGNSWTDPLVEDLRGRGYEVRQFAYDEVQAWDNDRPVTAIGFSYGGETLCVMNAAGCRVDRMVLLNPVRQGNIFRQGEAMRIGKVQQLKVYATPDTFPKASTTIIDSTGNEYHAEIVHDARHSSLVAKVENKIMNLFDSAN